MAIKIGSLFILAGLSFIIRGLFEPNLDALVRVLFGGGLVLIGCVIMITAALVNLGG